MASIHRPVVVPVMFNVNGAAPPASFAALEDSVARFSDLAGQVEINDPQLDGSFDPEDWFTGPRARLCWTR